jgi:hypothetical protein
MDMNEHECPRDFVGSGSPTEAHRLVNSAMVAEAPERLVVLRVYSCRFVVESNRSGLAG